MRSPANKMKDVFSDCEKATLLVEKEQLEPLSSEDNLYMTIHLEGCLVCRTYQVQSNQINNALSQIFEKKLFPVSLDEAYKRKLRAKIAEAVNRH